MTALYDRLHICSTGLFTLGTSPGSCPTTAQPTNTTSTTPLVAPFWSNLVSDGSLIFCSGGDADVTWDAGIGSNKVDALIRKSSAVAAPGFVTSSYVAITWRSLRYQGVNAAVGCEGRHTFQAVLARTTDTSTFLILQVSCA